MRTRLAILLILLAFGCGSRPIDSTDCDGMCQIAGDAFPGVGECVDGVCTPTYAIYFDMPLCEDTTRVGLEVERGCDEPIEWQINEAVKCCCEQETPP